MNLNTYFVRSRRGCFRMVLSRFSEFVHGFQVCPPHTCICPTEFLSRISLTYACIWRNIWSSWTNIEKLGYIIRNHRSRANHGMTYISSNHIVVQIWPLILSRNSVIYMHVFEGHIWSPWTNASNNYSRKDWTTDFKYCIAIFSLQSYFYYFY